MYQVCLARDERRDGEVPSQKELSSYVEELFSSKVPSQKELSSFKLGTFPQPWTSVHVCNRGGEIWPDASEG